MKITKIVLMLAMLLAVGCKPDNGGGNGGDERHEWNTTGPSQS